MRLVNVCRGMTDGNEGRSGELHGSAIRKYISCQTHPKITKSYSVIASLECILKKRLGKANPLLERNLRIRQTTSSDVSLSDAL
jgi:hypothetical protein